MTTTPATQAILPVSQSDRDAAADYVASFKIDPSGPSKSVQNTRDGKANSALVQAFARHRQAHSLPGDAVRSAILWQLGVCANNYERDGKEVEAYITRWHMGWIEHAIFDAALTPSALSGDAGEGRDKYGNSAGNAFESACLGISHQGAGE